MYLAIKGRHNDHQLFGAEKWEVGAGLSNY